MKYISLIIIMSFLGKFTNAQQGGFDLAGQNLKGKVKQVIESNVEKDSLDSKNDSTKLIRDYDSNGKEVDNIYYERDGRERKTFFKFTLQKIIASEYIDGKLISTTTHSFDAKNKEIEMDVNSNADLTDRSNKKMKTIFKYDKKGNRIEEESYLDEKINFKNSIIYNTKNQKIEINYTNYTRYMPNLVKNEKDIIQYDEAGNVVKIRHYDSKGILLDDFVGSYSNIDQHGNWLQKKSTFIGYQYNTTKTNYISLTIAKRTITYFE